MRLRRSSGTAPEAVPSEPTAPASGAHSAGKGRPTPKRRDAQPKRVSPFAAPSNAREAREARRRARLEVREGLARGDDSKMPARDRGPARRFVRDYVDSRRLASEFLLPLGLVLYVLVFAGRGTIASAVGSLGLLALFVILIIELIRVGFGAKRAVEREFPDDPKTRGAGLYAASRAPMVRRWRLPPATVKVGERPDRRTH